MATGRMLRGQISISEQVNELSLKAALLFTWMIPHTDDFGRMLGSPKKVKAIVVPLRDDISSQDVDIALNEMHEKGLICRYKANDEYYIQFIKFEVHQQGLHKRTKSKILPPEEGNPIDFSKSFPETPGNSTTELELELEKNKETLANANVKKKKKSPDCPYDEIFDLYERILVEEPKADPKFMRPIAVHINSRNDERKRLLLKRWQESLLFQDLQFWEAFFWVIRDTPLYNGSITNNEYKTAFKPDIEWMLKTKFNRIVDKLPRDDSPPSNQEAAQENLILTHEEEI
jgi:hypothetical protein